MQPTSSPSPRDCRERKAGLQATYRQIADQLRALGYSYSAGRLRQCFTGGDLYPDRVNAAAWEAMDAIEAERMPSRAGHATT